jgi:hypothetical protein
MSTFFRIVLAAVLLAAAGIYLTKCTVEAVRAELRRQP